MEGDAPNASDRLIVTDEGIGDLVLVRQAPDSRSGRVSIAPGAVVPLPEVVFDGIERLDIPANPLTGGTGLGGDGQVVVFQPDEFELNDNRLIATDFGDVLTTHRDPNIDPGGNPDAFGPGDGTPGDEDWYQFRSPKIGTFRFDVLFTPLDTVPSGRQGLPGDGLLDAAVYDQDGVLIVDVDSDAVAAGEQLTFSAAAGKTYFLRVEGCAAGPGRQPGDQHLRRAAGRGRSARPPSRPTSASPAATTTCSIPSRGSSPHAAGDQPDDPLPRPADPRHRATSIRRWMPRSMSTRAITC